MLRPDFRIRPWLPALAILGLSLVPGQATAQIRVADENKSLFSIPRSQDDIHALRMARADAAEGRFAHAVERLHTLLERDRHGLMPTRTGLYLGMRTAVIRTLRDLPEAGQAAYEKITAREAGDLLRTAFIGRNLQGLRSLADRFPTSTGGRRARFRLASLMLEAGKATAAVGEYGSLLETLSATSPLRPLATRRLEFAKSLRRAQAGHPGAGDDDAAFLASSDNSSEGWAAYGDGRDSTTPMTFPSQLGSNPLKFRLASPGYASFYPLMVHATGGLSGLFFNNGHKVICIDPLGGLKKWEAAGPMVGAYGAEYSDTLNRSMLLSVALSTDVVVAALQVPNANQSSSYRNLDLRYKLPTRRLFAFNRHTGKRLWSHFDYLGGPVAKRFMAHNAPAPPIIVGDTVYVPTEHYTGAVSYYLSAYSLKTGQERWRTLICSSQLEVNMFGNAKLEYAATPVAIHEGTLYGTTNLGLNFAADAITGRVKWCSVYPVIPLPRTRLRGQNSRQVFFANNPILVHDGVMLSTPLDSEHVVAMRVEDGSILWRMSYNNQAGQQNLLMWSLGLMGDEAIFSGRGVVGVKLQPDGNGRPQVRQIRLPQYVNGGMISGIARGAVTERYITHPTRNGLQAFDRNGNAAPQKFGVQEPGNLLMVDGLFVSARANEVQIFLDREFLLDEARQAIKNEPDNPSHYLRLGSLMRGGTLPSDLTGVRGMKTLSLLRQGLAAARRSGLSKDSALYVGLATELFRIAMMRADHTANAGPKNRAIELFERARSESPDVDSWIKAHLRILALHAKSRVKTLAELDRLAKVHGGETYQFERLGRLPVRSYVLWQSIPHLQDPVAIVERCQDLLEHFPDVPLWRETARSFALRTISEHIVKSGRKVYGKIEARAARQLADAGEDPERLREVDRRYPHSAAALTARQLVLDKAVLTGDLATAAAMASRNLQGLTPGMMRRLMVAAKVAKNLPLAAALGRRLLADHGEVVSDFAPDAGKTMAEIVTIPKLPTTTKVALELPVKQLGKPLVSTRKAQFEVLATEVVAGYPTTDNRPLYLTDGGDRLLGFDLEDPTREPLFTVDSNLAQHLHRAGERLLLCGIHLIVNETEQVRALHFRTGAELWRYAEGEDRLLRVMGVQNGIVHLFSSLPNDRDGGQILGLDLFTGARLFSHVFPSTQETLVPRAYEGDLWTLHNPEDSSRVEVLRIDGVTGKRVHKFTIPTKIVAKLVPASRIRQHMSLKRLQATMIVDANTIYLTTNNAGGVMPPFVAALHHRGGLKWTWKSRSQRGFIKLRALHKAGYVILETSPGSRITSRLALLNRSSGIEKRGIRMQGAVRALHDQAHPFAPDFLMLEESRPHALVGYSLDGKQPSFRYTCSPGLVLWKYPVIGQDFFAAPVITTNAQHLELLTLRLKDRRAAMPDGRKTRRLSKERVGGAGTKLFAHDRFTICQTPRGIQILGSKEPKKR